MIKNYYLLYKENEEKKKRIDYVFYLRLYQLATYNSITESYNKIEYKSISQLAEKLNMSGKTLRNKLKDIRYKDYFIVDYNNNIITLNNSFKNTKPLKGYNIVVLNIDEVDYLINKDNSLMIKYYLYIKYNCNRIDIYNKYNNTNKVQDFTQEQCLLSIGYNSKSGKNKGILTQCNNDFVSNGFIIIQNVKMKGKPRLIYKLTPKARIIKKDDEDIKTIIN